MRGSSKHATGTSTDHHVHVALNQTSSGYRFSAVGKHVNLLALDTGVPDLTVAFDIGGVTFAHNRNLSGKKNVFRISRRRV